MRLRKISTLILCFSLEPPTTEFFGGFLLWIGVGE